METLVALGVFLALLGAFFVGIAFLYAVSVWDNKNKGK